MTDRPHGISHLLLLVSGIATVQSPEGGGSGSARPFDEHEVGTVFDAIENDVPAVGGDISEVRIVVTSPPPVMFTGTLVRIDRNRGRDAESSPADWRGESDCSDRTIEGSYGIHMQGTRPSAPGGPIETVIGVVTRTYDGLGRFTQIDNVKGSISGVVLDRHGSGTYQVAANCTAIAQLQPGSGIAIEERMVIVDDADQILSGAIAPVPVMVTTVQKRIR